MVEVSPILFNGLDRCRREQTGGSYHPGVSAR